MGLKVAPAQSNRIGVPALRLKAKAREHTNTSAESRQVSNSGWGIAGGAAARIAGGQEAWQGWQAAVAGRGGGHRARGK
jgi:hypothetical protein